MPVKRFCVKHGLVYVDYHNATADWIMIYVYPVQDLPLLNNPDLMWCDNFCVS
jgi:hypothetical protein